MLAALPDTPERVQQELALQTTLGPAPGGHEGLCIPGGITRLHPGACALPAGGRDPTGLPGAAGLVVFLPDPVGVADSSGVRGAPPILAQQVGDPVLRVEAHYALGLTLNYLGKFTDAQTHLAQGIALYNPQQHHTHAVRYGQDPGAACRAYGAANLWWLGYPEQALRWSHEAVTLARELAHPFSLGFALFLTSWVPQFRREGPLTHERAEAAIALAAEHGFAVFGAGGTIFRGWALAARV